MPVLRVIENSRPGPAPAVMLDGVSIRYGGNGAPVYEAVAPVSLRVAENEFVAIVGPDRLRQVHPAQRGGRACCSPAAGTVAIFGAAARGAQRQGGLPVPAGRADAVEDGARQRRHRARGRRARRAREALEQARRWLRRVGLLGLRRPLSASALGRPAQARRPRAGADPRSQDPADGRALRPARRADAPDHGRRCCSTCGPPTARPCCSSRTTWKRRSRSPTAS